LQACSCGALSLTRGRVCRFPQSQSVLISLLSVCTITSQNQSHIATDGQSVSKSWCRAPSGAHDQIFVTVWQLRTCSCGVPSLTRGHVCHLYMLLTLSSTVFLGSETLRTRDHILLSQIWDFPFRRLLRLAGSWWRYSTPPRHGYVQFTFYCFLYRIGTDHPQKTHQLLSNKYHVLLSGVSTHALPSNWRPSWRWVVRFKTRPL
jgi:hypothetical protein